ncbi:MAG: hypothetical protein JNM00_14975, partial [Flavobacteriales bacterium]|nr:hypothetical protein [Flavobacteriales bacterium]
MNLRFIIVCVVWYCPVVLTAQQRYFFTQFTTREGLSNNTVNAIVQDSIGYMWIGTDDGLNRFDGHHFTIFRHRRADDNSLMSNHVQTIELDNRGRIWAGGRGQMGVSVFLPEEGSFKRIYFPDSIARNVSDIFCDRMGTTWVGTDNGIFKGKYGQDVLVQLPQAKDKQQGVYGTFMPVGNSFAEAPDHAGFWLSTTGGMNYYDYATQTFFNRKHNPDSIRIFTLNANRPLVIDNNGILWTSVRKDDIYWYFTGFDESGDSIIFQTDDVTLDQKGLINAFRTMVCSPDNQLWLGNLARTPTIFDVASRSFDYSLAGLYPGSLTNHTLSAAFFDREGNVWVGMEEGLYVAFNIYKDIDVGWLGEWDEFKTPRIKCVFQPDPNTLLLAANQSVYWYNKSDKSVTAYVLAPDGIHADEDTRWIGKKSADEVWVASFFGLYSFNLKTKTFKRELTDIPEQFAKLIRGNSFIRFVISDDEENVMIGCASGLYVQNKTRGYFQLLRDSTQKGPAGMIFDYCTRSAGGWWFSQPTSGQIRYLERPDGPLLEYRLAEKLPASPNSLFEDEQDRLWVASLSSGIMCIQLKNGTHVTYGVDEGLHSNCVYKVLSDGRDLYAITSGGLARYNSSLDRFERIISEFSLPNYDHRDVGHVGVDGRIYLFSQNIFYSIDPDAFTNVERDRRVLISSCSMMGKEVHLGKQVSVFEFGANDLRIAFTTLNFNPNVGVRYEYMLHGLDNVWHPTNGESEVFFSSLPHGKFEFRVRSDNGTGIFSEDYTAFSFEIQPPWYATWWFRMLGLLLVVLTTWLVTRAYNQRRLRKQQEEMRQLKALEEERMRIARDMHDDLGGGLSSIRIMSERAGKHHD